MAARVALLAAMFGVFAHWYASWYPGLMFPNPAFLTMLCLYLTTFQQCLSLFLYYQGASPSNPWLNTAALHHYLFEITFPMNMIVTSLYWTLLHAPYMADPAYTDTILG